LRNVEERSNSTPPPEEPSPPQAKKRKPPISKQAKKGIADFITEKFSSRGVSVPPNSDLLNFTPIKSIKGLCDLGTPQIVRQLNHARGVTQRSVQTTDAVQPTNAPTATDAPTETHAPTETDTPTETHGPMAQINDPLPNQEREKATTRTTKEAKEALCSCFTS
jgi:hypothetical protein